MNVSIVRADILTDGTGAFSKKLLQVNGKLLQIRYVHTDLANGWGLSVVDDESGLVLVSATGLGQASFTRAPRQPTHDTALAASLFAAGGEPVESGIYMCGQPTVTVSSGGDTKQGKLFMWFGN